VDGPFYKFLNTPLAYSALCIILECANQWSGGAGSLFVLEHKWGTITSKGARWSGSQHWGACARHTDFGRAGCGMG